MILSRDLNTLSFLFLDLLVHILRYSKRGEKPQTVLKTDNTLVKV